jgi:3-isopropylmalate dehydrogenase
LCDPRYDLNIPNVANRLEKAVDQALDAGYRTKDIYKEGPNTKLVKCSEMGEILLKSVSA